MEGAAPDDRLGREQATEAVMAEDRPDGEQTAEEAVPAKEAVSEDVPDKDKK